MKTLTFLEENILLTVYHLKDNAYLISIKNFLEKQTGMKLAVGSVFAPLNRLHKNGLLKIINGKPSPKVELLNNYLVTYAQYIGITSAIYLHFLIYSCATLYVLYIYHLELKNF